MAQWKAERSGLFATERFVHRFPKEEAGKRGDGMAQHQCPRLVVRPMVDRGFGADLAVGRHAVSEENTKLVGNDKRVVGGVLISIVPSIKGDGVKAESLDLFSKSFFQITLPFRALRQQRRPRAPRVKTLLPLTMGVGRGPNGFFGSKAQSA